MKEFLFSYLTKYLSNTVIAITEGVHQWCTVGSAAAEKVLMS